MGTQVITRGDRELALRFDTFPSQAKQKLQERITALTDELEARVQGAAPVKTGALRSEITPKVYADSPSRVAGYVSVFAPGVPQAYPKAATLEYGTDKVRRVFSRTETFINRRGNRQRIVDRMTRPVHIRAFRYLRDPFDAMRPQVEAALDEAIAEAVAEEGGNGAP